MKVSKKITIAGVIVTVLFGVAYLYSIVPQTIHIQTSTAEVVYNNGDKHIKGNMSNEDALAVYTIFDGKTLVDDMPSCTFTSNVSLRYGDQIFCIACDRCLIVKLQNKNKYFAITEADRKLIERVFEEFGGTFPCV